MELRRSINTRIWDDSWFSELPTEEKILWIYLITNQRTNMLGVYEISERKIAFDTNIPLERIRNAFKGFETLKKAKYNNGYVILFNWVKNQAYNPNMIKSALQVLEELPANIKISVETAFKMQLKQKYESLSKASEPFESLSNRAISNNEKEKEKEVEGESTAQAEIFKTLIGEKIWLESMSMTYESSPELIIEHLRKFYTHCINNDYFKGSTEDAKRHFNSWIRKGNPPTKSKKQTSNWE